MDAPRKRSQGVGASYSVLLRYPHQAKLIADIYPKKYKCDTLSGIIITKREVKRYFSQRGNDTSRMSPIDIQNI